eukprot:10144241-Alexandrium_andersonii.AAC.1
MHACARKCMCEWLLAHRRAQRQLSATVDASACVWVCVCVRVCVRGFGCGSRSGCGPGCGSGSGCGPGYGSGCGCGRGAVLAVVVATVVNAAALASEC